MIKWKKRVHLTDEQKIQNYKKEILTLEQVDYSPLYSQDVAYHNYGYIHTFRVISDGLRLSNMKQFMAGILAGIWIGLVYVAVAMATYSFVGADKAVLESLVKILTGLIFGSVILLISFLGGGFVTAHMWYNRTMFKKVERWSIFLKACGLVYAGNIIGIMIFTCIFQLSGALNHSPALAQHIYNAFGKAKLYEVGSAIEAKDALKAGEIFKTIGYVFASAVLCNFLICLATQGSKSAKGNTVAAMIMYFLVLFYFAIGGYQHCVANWFGAWMLILRAISDPTTQHANMAWAFVAFNIIPALLGNFVGALIIGTFMGLFNKEFDTLLVQEARMKFLAEEIERIENKKMKIKK
ncbi:formate/nitrite transporter [Mesoplasma entomophilum]|uniref:Formate/nitrite transporter n=1 Tax=Mesoplasma entomophilum TaxID=2149 RepID=A0A3S5XZ71_9MOLU|nr:formate/nitrite transporter family protein [Mesoplasma entomophilum]ATQ35346.1 hypothetical protein CS528_00995 [Mesoplasma entomophilum]ATZ19299.1 formate/nitrite transporter [Mesoplasma entomophilum]